MQFTQNNCTIRSLNFKSPNYMRRRNFYVIGNKFILTLTPVVRVVFYTMHAAAKNLKNKIT